MRIAVIAPYYYLKNEFYYHKIYLLIHSECIVSLYANNKRG